MKDIKTNFVISCSILITVLCPCFTYECNNLYLKKKTGMLPERNRMLNVQAKSFVKFIYLWLILAT
jgi:hypothetical protein